MKRVGALLLIGFLSSTGCTWFGLVDEEPVQEFGVPAKGAVTLIKEVSERTANVDFSSFYIELDPNPVVRIEGRATSVSAFASLKSVMEESRDLEGVAKSWGSLSKYEEMNFGLRAGVVADLRSEFGVNRPKSIEGSALMERILADDSTRAFDGWLTSIPFPSQEWENGWSCEVVEMRYDPNDRNRLYLQKFLDILKGVEMQTPLVRVVIARIWVEDGQVSRAILRWNCYQQPPEEEED